MCIWEGGPQLLGRCGEVSYVLVVTGQVKEGKTPFDGLLWFFPVLGPGGTANFVQRKRGATTHTI